MKEKQAVFSHNTINKFLDKKKHFRSVLQLYLKEKVDYSNTHSAIDRSSVL